MYKHKTGGIDLTVIAYFIVANGRGYVITCSAASDFARNTLAFEIVCKTFETFAPAKAPAKEGAKDDGKTSPDSL